MMLIGIARALDMTEQQKSLADILMHTNAAGFLLDLHGEEHTDEIGVHTVLRLLQRTSYRDACQPSLPGRPSPGAAERPSSSARRGWKGRRGLRSRAQLVERANPNRSRRSRRGRRLRRTDTL